MQKMQNLDFLTLFKQMSKMTWNDVFRCADSEYSIENLQFLDFQVKNEDFQCFINVRGL